MLNVELFSAKACDEELFSFEFSHPNNSTLNIPHSTFNIQKGIRSGLGVLRILLHSDCGAAY